MSLTPAEQRELAAIMNRNEVGFEFGALVIGCKRNPDDFERAYDLLAKQERNPERIAERRTLICRKRT